MGWEPRRRAAREVGGMIFPDRALFNKTAPECRFIGVRGGRASAVSRRLYPAMWPTAEPTDEPEFDPESAHEASVLLDERFPHLRWAFAKPKHREATKRGGRFARQDNRYVVLDGRRMPLVDAARQLGISNVALHFRLVSRTGGKNYDGVDVRAVGADRKHTAVEASRLAHAAKARLHAAG
jgi:hypothetical protein